MRLSIMAEAPSSRFALQRMSKWRLSRLLPPCSAPNPPLNDLVPERRSDRRSDTRRSGAACTPAPPAAPLPPAPAPPPAAPLAAPMALEPAPAEVAAPAGCCFSGKGAMARVRLFLPMRASVSVRLISSQPPRIGLPLTVLPRRL